MAKIDKIAGAEQAVVAALIARVGARVRKAREMKNVPRRVLSEMSGVSPRYLAQLEAGDGNISIALLQRVASALDLRIEWLIGEDDPWTSDAVRVADLFRSASPDARRRVLGMLSPHESTDMKGLRICLIGLRGAGKSTLGHAAGAALNVPFIELNGRIEERSGMPVSEVLALYGQEGYRKLEAQALEAVAETPGPLILAAAGGIVSEPETFATVLERFHTIWVQTSPDEHMARVRAQGDQRPMAGNPEAMAQLRTILSAREAVYARADARLDTAGRSVEASVSDLLDLIAARGFLEAAGEAGRS